MTWRCSLCEAKGGQLCRTPFAGISRIRFQGCVSIRVPKRPSSLWVLDFRIPLAVTGILIRGSARSMARLMLKRRTELAPARRR